MAGDEHGRHFLEVVEPSDEFRFVEGSPKSLLIQISLGVRLVVLESCVEIRTEVFDARSTRTAGAA